MEPSGVTSYTGIHRWFGAQGRAIHTKTGATEMHLAPRTLRFYSSRFVLSKQITLRWRLHVCAVVSLLLAKLIQEDFSSQWLHKHSRATQTSHCAQCHERFCNGRVFGGALGLLDIYACIEDGFAAILWAQPPQSLQEVIVFITVSKHNIL